MQIIVIYFITLIISYIATIPPGPLSVFVVHTAIQKNLKIALWVAIGGVFCESIYAFLAVIGLQIFIKYPLINYWVQWIIIVLLIGLGIFTFFQKTQEIKQEKIAVNNRILSCLKGTSLSLFNPALLPFWLVVLIEYQKKDFLKINNYLTKVAFVLGAGTGTFLLVFTYAFIAYKKRNLVYKYLTDSRINKIIGAIFFGLGIWQLANMLFCQLA
jgi:threonine/homoserine/homoserine lactone efflux protein